MIGDRVPTDAYFFVDVVWKKTGKTKAFKHTVPCRGYNLKSQLNFNDSLFWVDTHSYREVSKQEWEKKVWGCILDQGIILNITPLKKKVLVAENKAEQTTESGIILDGTTSNRDSKQGTVLAIGPQVTMVKVGDVIMLEWNKAQVVKIGDAQRVIIDEENIVAVVEGDNA